MWISWLSIKFLLTHPCLCHLIYHVTDMGADKLLSFVSHSFQCLYLLLFWKEYNLCYVMLCYVMLKQNDIYLTHIDTHTAKKYTQHTHIYTIYTVKYDILILVCFVVFVFSKFNGLMWFTFNSCMPVFMFCFTIDSFLHMKKIDKYLTTKQEKHVNSHHTVEYLI